MKTLIFSLLLVVGLSFCNSVAAQDSTVVSATQEQPTTIEKVDQVVNEIGQITGVDTLHTIDEALAAVKGKIAELEEGGKRAWYEWVLFGIASIATLLGLYQLVRKIFG